ncbi:MAG: hypothetical protein H6Q76_1513 [Firmicutes bacterium]|nr:hypothetical protein [Bacillota bacterium]
MDTTGNRIRALRKKAGLTQLELAKHFDVDRSTVASWEVNRREPDFDTLVVLANLFNVPTDYLLGRVDNPTDELVPKRPASPGDFHGENIGDPIMDEITDNLKLMTPDERETFLRLTKSVVNRKTEDVG